MSEPADKDALNNLHDALAKALKARIDSADATASDLNVARQFLKDNGVECIPTKANPIGQLKDRIPTFDRDDEFSPPSRPN